MACETPPPFIANAIVNFHIFLPSPKMNMNMNVISSTINVLSQEEGRGALEEQRLPTLQNARSLQDEVGSSHWQCYHPSCEMFKARCKEDHFDLRGLVKNYLADFFR